MQIKLSFLSKSPNRYEGAAQVVNSFDVGMSYKTEVTFVLCAHCIYYL